MQFEEITIIGVGLIGGSVGMAAKAHGIAKRVVGVGRDEPSLARACKGGAIDDFTTSLKDATASADLVVVCTPVDRIGDVILDAAPHCRAGTIVTDAGSTKGNILARVCGKLPAGIEFVPAHPLAGGEKNGVAHARADLFEGHLTILTPELFSPAVGIVEAFWRDLGSRVVSMSAADHDRILATTSHMPHAVSACIASLTPRDWLLFAAGGFRDVTRIAGGDPELWAAIFQANRDAVLRAATAFSQRFEMFRNLVETGNGAGLVKWLTEAKQVRDALGN
jgi:prephenate dehydrogenase